MSQKTADSSVGNFSPDPGGQKDPFPLSGGEWDVMKELPAAIYACDEEGRITFYNQAAVDLWGQTPALGKDLWCGSWKIYHTDGSPMSLEECPMAVALREKRAVKAEEIIIERPDGVRVNVIPHPKPLVDRQGRNRGSINMLIDISDKRDKEVRLRHSERKYKELTESLEKQVEERTLTLRESEERYHKMIDEVQDYAIIMLDDQGNILNWNRGAEKIKGYSEDEILGKSFRIFYTPEDRDTLPDQLINIARTKGRAVHEGWRMRKDGSRFWGSIVITALHDKDNNVIGFSKVTRDLTERKLAEDRMKEYARDIEARNKQLEEFAYIASHDLQEPLRKIQLFADLLERNISDEETAKRHLGRINSSAKRMATLIKGVLEYSQLSKYDKLFTSTDLNQVLAGVIEDFDIRIAEKNARIHQSQLPVLRAIPVQMHQLFSNMISNSLKFSCEEPVIEITGSRLARRVVKEYQQLHADQNYVAITIRDNGLGFDERYADQAFKLFQRLDSDGKGAGIGLALCKRIVENHKGIIEVESEVGNGTTFTVILPE